MLLAAGVGLSLVTGYGRDASIAAALGATRSADSFFVAYSWIDLAVSLLPITLAAGMVPALARAFEGPRRLRLAGAYLLLFPSLAVLVAMLVGAFADTLSAAMAPGLGQSAQKEVATAMRLMAPALPGLAVSAVAAAILSMRMRFAAAVLSGSVYNLVLAVAALSVAKDVRTLALAATVGALVQGATLGLIVTTRSQARMPSTADLLLGMRTLGSFAFLAGGAVVNYSILIVDRALASSGPLGSIAELNYAIRLSTTANQLVGLPLAMVIFPMIAMAIARGETAQTGSALRDAVRRILLITLPAICFVLPWRDQFVELLYVHGAFARPAVAATALLMSILLLGFAADNFSQLAWRLIFSLRRFGTFMVLNCVQLATHAMILVLLFPWLGLVGIAIAIAAGLGLQVLFLILVLHRVSAIRIVTRTEARYLVRVGACSLPVASVALTASSLAAHAPFQMAILLFVGSLVVGFTIALLAAQALALVQIGEIVSAVCRQTRPHR